MAAIRLIGETRREDRRPTRVFEGTAHDYLQQIAAHLRAQGLTRHAALFAEPNPLADRVQWMTDLPGDIRRLVDLPEEKQGALAATTASLVEDVVREAERLRSDRNPSNKTLGEVLAAAADGSRLGDIVLVGDQPMLAGWGLRAVDNAAPVPNLLNELRRVARPTTVREETVVPVPAPVPVPPPPVSPWPLRLLAATTALLLIAAGIAWFLPELVSGALASLRLPRPELCVPEGPPPGAGIVEAQAEEARLRARISELERAMTGRIIQCRLAEADRRAGAGGGGGAAVGGGAAGGQQAAVGGQQIEERLRREGARSGAVQVSLAWDNYNDLDIFIVCPGGQPVIFHKAENRKGCGGELDVDMNFEQNRSATPVENVTWPEGAAPAGEYRVLVSNQGGDAAHPGAVPFVVRIRVGEKTWEVRGISESKEPRDVTKFTVP